MIDYKRLTNKDWKENYDIFDDVCCDTCTEDCGECERNFSALVRLADLEDKIKNGTLVELPCKVGDTAMAIIDTLAYDNSLQRVKIEGLAYIVKDENGDITFQHINRLFSNEAEAEARLKELNNSYKETGEF